MVHSFIIRFPNEKSRNEFRKTLHNHPNLAQEDVEFGEFLPDVIVRGVSDQILIEFKQIVDPQARIFEDFKHHLFIPSQVRR